MKKIVCLAIVLAVFANVNTFSASKKSSGKKSNTSSTQINSEAPQLALKIINTFLKKEILSDGTADLALTATETQNWVYNNPKFTDDFKTEYSNYVAATNMNICDEDFDDVDGCRHFDKLEDEEKEFYDKYWFHPFGQGQDIPTGFELVRYNEKDGYVIVKPESGDHWNKYLMYIKVINKDGEQIELDKNIDA